VNRLPTVLLVAISLAACGAQQTPSTQAAAASPPRPEALPDRSAANTGPRGRQLLRAPACSYLTVAEVSDILRGPIGKPAEKESENASSCSYPPLDMTSYQQAQIDVEWQAASTSTLEDKMASTFGGSAVGSQVAHQLQLGDASSYSREGILRIHAGSALISVTLMMRPDSEEKAVAIGKLLLERMGYEAAQPAVKAGSASGSLAAAEPRPEGSEVAKGIVIGEHCAEPDARSRASFAKAAQDEKSSTVPLKVGLTLGFTWTKGAEPEDHECLEQVVGIAEGYVDITESCAYANGKRSHNQRRVCRQDMQQSHIYHPALWERAPAVISPTTLISLSTEAFRALKTSGSTPHRWLELYPNPTHAQAIKFDVDATLVVDPVAPKTYAVLVNDKLVQLPVITSTSKKSTPDADDDDGVSPLVKQLQAAVLSDEPTSEDPHGTGVNAIIATTLDDERFPLMLDYQVPAKNYRVKFTKITYGSEPEMEKQLAAREPVTVYGIYFDFASDSLRPESTPILDEIAVIMAKNPGWKLSVTGHTDDIGGNASNLDLSKRRAAAVKTILVERYQIDASRLTTDGAGASAPQDTNNTPEGRARNRRVVLRRES
jgi:outer membrane protein OmpA-like peptidoglycan-associated protein